MHSSTWRNGFPLAILLAGALNARAVEALSPSAATATGSTNDTLEAERAIKGFVLPPGFLCEVAAAAPLLANPVAFAFDEQGRFFVAETFRFEAGVPDIRGRMHWLETELASQSVAERIAYTHRLDTNGLAWWTNREDRLSLIWDSDGDGRCDRSTNFASGFNALEDGIGSGVLARRGAVYYTDVPNLWLLQDTNHDGVADSRRSLSHGYGVRYGFIGHDLHGLQIGPDGRLYFSMGDRGARVELANGKTLDSTESGAVFRCELDGSNLEIVYTGLRNPQELAFDNEGNLWTVDNNSDAGDPARVVYLAEGGDGGWRIGWQFLEQPFARGSWLGERICYEDFPDRAAYALPPVSSKVSNGPSGLAFDPGTGLPPEWRGRFFLANFSGSPAPYSGVYAFTVRPRGAGFELGRNDKFWWNILVTDVDFGYDGCLYATDWITGWNGTGRGRIYRVYQPEAREQALATGVKRLFAEGFTQRGTPELVALLAHPDRRVRMEAQFALVERKADLELMTVAAHGLTLFSRLHAIWGLGQRERTGGRLDFKPLLADAQSEVRAQSAKVLGDARDARYETQLIGLLADPEPRVRYFAAIALGKLGSRKGVPAVLAALRAGDSDPWFRHAVVMTLLGGASSSQIAKLSKDASENIRLAAVVALRRLNSPMLEKFLADKSPRVVAEAARAINDLPVASVLPALAALADNLDRLAGLPPGSKEMPSPRDAILRRVVNANQRLGTPAAAARLAAMAGDTRLPDFVRVEAIKAFDDWAKPRGVDRVSGLWRPLPERPPPDTRKLQPALESLLKADVPADVQVALLATAGRLRWLTFENAAFALLQNSDLAAAVRVAALEYLGVITSPRLDEALALASDSTSEALRLAFLRVLATTASGERLTTPFARHLATGSVRERQTVIALLGRSTDAGADRLLIAELDALLAGGAPVELQLDLVEAAARRRDAQVKERLARIEAQRAGRPVAEQFGDCLAGGDAAGGEKVFLHKSEAACLRCHKVNGEGGDVAPDLSQIGARSDRAYILESLILPNNRIASGYDTCQMVLKTGHSYDGVVQAETDEELDLLSPEDGRLKIRKSDIQSRKSTLSAMPDNMREILTRHEIRDLVEYLAGLK